ncbi:MAG: alkyl hydroperoxide reductase subunit AhpC [Maribacter sp.]|jgi:alkyl hydroperoxide reductase subunit AhpC
MRNILFFISILFIFSCQIESNNEAQVIEKGENNILDLLSSHKIDGDSQLHSKVGYVAVVVPTLTDQNVFDLGLHMAGFYTYLESEARGGVETILISSDSIQHYSAFISSMKENNPIIFKELSFISDTSSILVNNIAAASKHLDHAGFALVYDADGNFMYHIDEYRCQGEKLQRFYQTFYPRKIANYPTTSYEIKKEEKLPAELLKYVDSYIGQQNVMFTFYPSPLSHACSIQMNDFTQLSEQANLKMFAVSIGDEAQINSWKMNQYVGLDMIADSTGIVSNDFNSLLREEDGIVYSDRTVFIIDKEGIVQYINKDYDVVADLSNLEEAILALSK